MKLTSYVLFAFFLGLSTTYGQDECPENTVMCLMDCPYGFQKDHKGCSLCQCLPQLCQNLGCPVGRVCRSEVPTDGSGPKAYCSDPRLPLACQLLQDPGSCKGKEERWYYNVDTDQCDLFYYGGCQGNDNKFTAEDDCTTLCQPVAEGSCSPGSCYMYCEHGLKTDERGCDICECNVTAGGGGGEEGIDVDGDVKCDESLVVMCAKACPYGFRQDKNGCEVCECRQENEHVEHFGNEECLPVTCMMFCDHGYLKDANGCNLCECREPEVKCPEAMCMMECQYGFRKNETGCDTCECRTEEECHGTQCRMKCPYGFWKDETNCNLCICHDPCQEAECDEDLSCLVVNTNADYEAKCVPQHFKERQWCGDQIMCTLECEHGFKSDEKGCPTCACLEGAPSKCQPVPCDASCPFGRTYDDMGCLTCDCVKDPCIDFACGAEEVCEAFKQKRCLRCPPEARCLKTVEVQRVRLQLIFSHPPIEALDERQFEEELREIIGDLFDTDDKYILGVRVRCLTAEVTTAHLHVVADEEDLVEAYEEMREELETDSGQYAITLEGTEFVIQADKLAASYSSVRDVPKDEMTDTDEEEAITTQTIIIIAAVAAVVIIVIAIVVIVMACRKNRHKQSQSSRNVAYSKTAQSEAVRVNQKV